MKTAIIITGAMRTFDRCILTQHWHVYRHFSKADFFVSTYRDGTEHQAELLREKYPHNRVEIRIDDAQPDCVEELRRSRVSLPAEWVKGRPYTHEPYPITVHPQAVLRQLWQLRRGRDLLVDTVGETEASEYDCIIRIRPDLWFHSFDRGNLPAVRMALRGIDNMACTPWWGRFGGCNDRFAVMGSRAAHAYFGTYDRIASMMAEGAPLHPETLVHTSMRQYGCTIQATLDAEFSTLRPNGEFRAPEIWPSDIAHFRGR